jgi:uncharacterized integral membrane protein
MNAKRKDALILFVGVCMVIGLGILAFRKDPEISALTYRVCQTKEIPLAFVIFVSAVFGSLVTILAYTSSRPKQKKSDPGTSSKN